MHQMRYLLDTNILSDLVRNPNGRVMQRIRDVGEAQVCTSIIVAAELRYGAAKKGSPRLKAQVEAVLGHIEVLPFKAPADTTYGMLRARLEQGGQPIGSNTLLIAAHAVTLGYAIIPLTNASLLALTVFSARTGYVYFGIPFTSVRMISATRISLTRVPSVRPRAAASESAPARKVLA